MPMEVMSNELPGDWKTSYSRQTWSLGGRLLKRLLLCWRRKHEAGLLVNVFLLCFSLAIHVSRQGVGVKGMRSRIKTGIFQSFTGRLVFFPLIDFQLHLILDWYHLGLMLCKTAHILLHVFSLYPKQQFQTSGKANCYHPISPFLVMEIELAFALAQLPTHFAILNKWPNLSDSALVCQMKDGAPNFSFLESHPLDHSFQ